MNPAGKGTLAGALLLLSVAWVSPARSDSDPDSRFAKFRQRLAGHVLSAQIPAIREQRTAADRRIRFLIVLRPSTESVEAEKDAGKDRRKFLKVSGPRQSYGEVMNFLLSGGVQIEKTYNHRLLILAQATAAQLEDLFGVEFYDYRIGDELHYATVADPRLPPEIASEVLAIVGLNDVLQFHKGQQPALAGTSIPQLQQAYGAASLLTSGVDGTGQVIAIIAPGNFNDADIQTFWTNNSVNRVLSSLVLRNARPATPADTEATLDIELASGMAPGSPVYVYFSGLDSVSILAALGQIADEAQTINPTGNGTAAQPFLSVLSMSFTTCDAFLSQADVRAWEALFSALTASGVTLFAASGDTGVAGCSTGTTVLNLPAVGFPASSPLVTAVGGTALTTDLAGNRTQEIAWAKTPPFTTSSSGGGTSRIFVRPPWQSALSVMPDNARLVPDVSLAASTLDFYISGLDLPAGGTSASSPLWAAILALVNQDRVAHGTVPLPIGFLLPKLYELGGTTVFRDINDGGVNDWTDGAGNVLVPGYAAGSGYDLVTGWGVPDVPALATALRDVPQQWPGSVTLFGGNNQSGSAGDTLAQPLVGQVSNSDGSPVSGFTVLFYDPLGNFLSAQTDASGQASLSYTVPSDICGSGVTVCSFQVLAIASGFLNSPLAFTVNPPTSTPGQMIKVMGDNQRTPVNSSFPFPLKVQVLDTAGNGMASVTVSFAGPGVESPSVDTDTHGYAETSLTAGATPGALQVTATAGALSATFNETILASVSGADIQVSASQIILATQVHHAVAQTFGVANVGDLSVRVVAAVAPSSAFLLTRTTTDGSCDFLTIAAGLTLSGRVTTLCVVGNPAGDLAAGDYSGAITVSADSGTNPTAIIALSLKVSPASALPEISLSPSSINLTAIEGNNPPPQTVTVSNAGGGILNWTASLSPAAAGWLSLSPASGKQGQTFTVSINSASLSIADYTGVITVQAPPALPKNLTVQLGVVSDAPRITLTSGNGQTGVVGQQLLIPSVVTVTDGAGNPLSGVAVSFAIFGTPEGATGQSLSVTSTTTEANGQAATLLTLGNLPGTYVVTATSPGAIGSPITFTATANLPTGVPPVITLGIQPPSLAYQAVVNGTAPVQMVTITNTGGGVLNWAASADQSWITLAPASGTAPSTLVVGVNTSGLGPGTYTGTLTVAAPGATNTPLTHAVALTVLPFASSLELVSGNDQTGAISTTLAQPLAVRVREGTGNPAVGIAVGFTLTAQPAGATGASLSATTATTDDQGQAQSTLTLGNQPGAYQVEVEGAGLTYQTVVFNETATAIVGPLSASITTVTASPTKIAADGTARAVITVIPRDTSGVNLAPGLAVTVNKTGGGTLSAVTDKGDGSYVATLKAPATPGSAVVSATVNSVPIDQTATVNFVVPVLISVANIYGETDQLAIDASDNVYVAFDASAGAYHVDRIDALTGAITVAPTDFGNPGYVNGVAVDRWENLYYAKFGGSGGNQGRVFKHDAASGAYAPLAGTGVGGSGVEEGPATLAALYGYLEQPYRLEVDKAGNVYIAESGSDRIRKVEAATGLILTVAGTGTGGFGGDGGPAKQALLSGPSGVAVDDAGNLYIADANNQRIRKVDAATGIITTVAGNGACTGYSCDSAFSGDGGPATAATLYYPGSVALDRWGNLYIADGSNPYNVASGRIRKVDAETGIITTVAGGGTGGLGSPATSADIGVPTDVAVDSTGNVYFVDSHYFASWEPVVYKVTASASPTIGLGVQPPYLAYQAVVNGSAAVQSVSINNIGGGTLNWTASADQPWITLAPTSGTAPSALTVGVNTMGLLPGTYTGTLTIAAPGATNTPQTATVTLTVLAFASSVESVNGDNQSGAINTTLPQPLAVRVLAGDGTPVAGIAVQFTITAQPAGAAGGSLSVTTATTDAQGQAQTSLTLGNQPGTYKVEVVAAGLTGQTAVFTETATATVGTLDTSTSALIVAPEYVAADGSARSVITVIPRDSSGLNLGPGLGVVVTKTGDGTLSAVTDKGDGSYVATLKAPNAMGSALLSATVNSASLDQTATVNFVVPVLISVVANIYGETDQLAIDASDNVYVAFDGSAGAYHVDRIDALTGAITVAPTDFGNPGYVNGVAVDRWENLYYAKFGGSGGNQGRVFKHDAASDAYAPLAGTGVGGSGVEEGPATLAALYGYLEQPYRLEVDQAGNVYIAESNSHRIRKVEAATGLILTVAGTGTGGFGGDGGPAKQALLSSPSGVAVDEAGNLYIADQGNHRIRKVEAATGIITTVAGNGTPAFTGDGGLATEASLAYPGSVALDRWGNLYIADGSNPYNVASGRIRKVDVETGIISTVAGGGTGGLGGPATSADIGVPTDVAVDSTGNIYFVDTNNGASWQGVVYKVSASAPPTISLGIQAPWLSYQAVVNGGAPSQSVSINNTGGKVLNWTASADQPWITLAPTSGTAPSTLVVGVTAAGLPPGTYTGTLTIAAAGATNTPQTAAVTLTVLPFASSLESVSGDPQSGSINSLLPQPLVVRARDGAGTPVAGIAVEFTLAAQPAGAAGASLSVTTATTDAQGQAQSMLTLGNQPGTYKVEVAAAGLTYQTVIFTETATATVAALSATATTLTAAPTNIAADGSARSVITVIPRDASGLNLGPGLTVLVTKMGDGTLSAVEDKGDGSYVASLRAPATQGSAVLSATVNSVSIAQTAVVSFTSGTLPIITLVGTFSGGCCGMDQITVDRSDNVYVADQSELYEVDGRTGSASVVSGLLGGYTVSGVATDRFGDLYYARFWTGGRVFKRDGLTGINTPYAGSGVPGVGLDEGPAILAALLGAHTSPYRMATDKAGNLYMVEGQWGSMEFRFEPQHRVRKVDAATGLISTIVGTGVAGFSGDGGPAKEAQLSTPTGIVLDEFGNLYIADRDNQRIRKVDATTGIITTVAGNGTQGFSGDGGPATSASLNYPWGVTVDRWGNLYIADNRNGRVRKVDAATGIITTVAGGGTGGPGSPAIGADLSGLWDVAVDSLGNLYIGVPLYASKVLYKVAGIGGDVTSALALYLSVVSGNNQSGAVGTTLAQPLVAKVSDTNGRPLAGQAVTFAISSQPSGATGASLGTASTATGADGLASTSLALGSMVGTYAVTAAVSGVAGLQVVFTENATPAAATTLTLEGGNNQVAPVLTTLAAPLVVKVSDANGNAVSGVVVNFNLTSTPDSATGMLLGTSAVATDGAGLASTTLKLGDQLGDYVVVASAAGLAPSGGVTFTATAGQPATTNPFDGHWTGSTLQEGQSPQPLAFVVQGSVIRAYSMQFVLPRCGTTVTLASTVASFALSGNTFSFVDFFSPGNLQRLEVAATFASSTQASGTFTVDDATCSESASGTWTATAPAAGGQIQIVSGNSQQGQVNKALPNSLLVRVVDGSGNPVANAEVNFAIASAPPGAQSAALSVTSALTDSVGQAATILTLGTLRGTYLVTATGPGGSQVIFTETAQAAEPAKVVKKSGDGQNGTAGSVLPVPICVTVTDAFNNALSEVAVNFAISSEPEGSSGAQLSVTAAPTGSDGTSCTQMTGGNRVGRYLETTSFPETSLSPVTFTVSVSEPQSLGRASGDMQGGTAGAMLPAPLVVQATDSSGLAVAGVDVSFNVSSVPQGATGTMVERTACRTDASGQCGTRLTLGNLAGVYTVTAVANDATGRSLVGSPLSFHALTTVPTTLAKSSGDNQFGAAGKPLGRPFAVTTTDAQGEPVSGVQVSFALATSPATATGMQVNPTTVVSDAHGLAQATLTLGDQLGAYSVTAAATDPDGNPLAGSPATFTATATQPSELSKVSGDGQTGLTLQSVGSPLVVRASDALGNPMSGIEVSYAVTQAPAGATGFAVLPAVCTTDADGQCSSVLMLGSQPGPYTVVASSPGLSPSGGVTFTATATLEATVGAFDGNWTGSTAQAGSPALPLGFSVRNSILRTYSIEFQLPQCGVTVALTNNAAALALVGNQFSLTEQFGPNNPITLKLDGSFSSATQAAGTFSVTDTSCNGSASGTWTATAPPLLSQIRIFSGNNQVGTVGKALAAPLSVLVTGATGQPVPNQPVTFGVAAQPPGSTGSSPSPTSTLTDANGLASAALTLGTLEGIYLVVATGPTGDQVTFVSTAQPDLPAKIVKRSGDNQNVTAGSVLPIPICVTVTDAFNNAIPGLAVLFDITSQPGGSSGAGLSVTEVSTATHGVACTQMTGGNRVGRYLETTSFPGTNLTSVEFTATVSQAASVEKTNGDNQKADPGTPLPNALVVTARDANLAGLAGVPVTFAMGTQPAGASGAAVIPASCTTDANGECRATLTLGNLEGPYTVVATATDATGAPLTGSPVEFVATASITPNPVPTLSIVAPSSGNRLETLNVVLTGTNFVSGVTTVSFGADIAVNSMTISSPTTLTANITVGAATGPRDVSVTNPAPGGGTATLTGGFTVTNPLPASTLLVPDQLTAGGSAFTLTVNGSNFAPDSVVQWNGANRSTTFVGSSQLTASILASDIAVAGTAQVTVFNPPPGGGVSNSLTFSITAPAVTLSAAGLTFAGQPVGTTSAAQTVTVTNSGTATLDISTMSLAGANAADFAKTVDGCSGMSVAPSGTCSVSVVFTPAATGPRSATLSITDNAADNPQTVSFSGTGVAPAVSISPSSLSFDKQLVGTPSAAQTVTVTNSGTATLDISTMSLAGANAADFAKTVDGCSGMSVASSGTCSVSVTFTPSTTGSRSATLTLTDSAADSPQTVSLSGTGVAPAVSISPSSLSFGNQLVGTSTAAQTVTVTNSGTATLNISTASLAGTNAADFAKTVDSCSGMSVAPSGTCSVSVVFTPAATGPRSATLSITTDNAGGSPHTVELTGAGINTPPGANVTISPTDIVTGSTPVTLTFSSVSQSGVTRLSTGSPCHALPSGFTPGNPPICYDVTTTAVYSGRVLIIIDFSGTAFSNPAMARLFHFESGIWVDCTVSVDAASHRITAFVGSLSPFAVLVPTTPAVSLSAANLSFGTQAVTIATSAQPVTLTNTGNGALTISSISITGANNSDFAQTNNCPLSPNVLAAVANCTINVTFTPTAPGSRTATLTITDNAGDSPHVVALTGTGVVAYSLASDKPSATVIKGTDATTFIISAATTYGFTGNIDLTCSGNAPATCAFSPAVIQPGQSSTLTVGNLSAVSGSALSFNVTGTSGSQSVSLPLVISIADFSLAASPTSATVTAGQTATYTLNITPAGGFNQKISLTCSGAPSAANCSISPVSVTPDGTNSAKATVTVSTTARSLAGPARRLVPPRAGGPLALPRVVWLLVLGTLSSLAMLRRRRVRFSLVVLAATALLTASLAACGGGGGVTPPPAAPPSGTPAGTYTLTLTGTYTSSSRSLSHITTVSLRVN